MQEILFQQYARRLVGGVCRFISQDLGASSCRSALERAGVSGMLLDPYIFGNVLEGGSRTVIALPRASLRPGSRDRTACTDMVCSSER